MALMYNIEFICVHVFACAISFLGLSKRLNSVQLAELNLIAMKKSFHYIDLVLVSSSNVKNMLP